MIKNEAITNLIYNLNNENLRELNDLITSLRKAHSGRMFEIKDCYTKKELRELVSHIKIPGGIMNRFSE